MSYANLRPTPHGHLILEDTSDAPELDGRTASRLHDIAMAEPSATGAKPEQTRRRARFRASRRRRSRPSVAARRSSGARPANPMPVLLVAAEAVSSRPAPNGGAAFVSENRSEL
jgi:hypothetical protein